MLVWSNGQSLILHKFPFKFQIPDMSVYCEIAPPALPFREGSLICHLRDPMKTALQLSVPVSIHQLRDSVRTYGILLRFAG